MLKEIQHWFEKKQPEKWSDLPEGQLVVLWQLEPNLSFEEFQRELEVYDSRRVNDNPFDL
jgi:hypothetical protein